MIEITKQQTLEIKGIAILMMLFLHLFNTMDRVEECTTYVNFLNRKPLVYALSRVCGFCVPFYLLLSGYGLTCSNRFDSSTFLRRLRRIMGQYWLVLVVFIPAGCWLKPDLYPQSAGALFKNLFTLSCSYNGEWWFLFPYLLLMGFSGWVVRETKRLRVRSTMLVFLLFFAINFATKLIPKEEGWVLVRNSLTVLPAFYAGCIIAVYRGRIQLPVFCRTNRGAWLSLLSLCFGRMLLGASQFNTLFCIALLLLYLQLQIPGKCRAALSFFGRYLSRVSRCQSAYSNFIG